jgi:hypothetical protein
MLETCQPPGVSMMKSSATPAEAGELGVDKVPANAIDVSPSSPCTRLACAPPAPAKGAFTIGPLFHNTTSACSGAPSAENSGREPIRSFIRTSRERGDRSLFAA